MIESISQPVIILLKDGTKTEIDTKKRLVDILEEYDVNQWIFADTVLIADKEIPHSHPTLTLNSRPQSDLSLLSVFIHENIHWFLNEKGDATNHAIEKLKVAFPEVPETQLGGARDNYSTYLHLLVNRLEYIAITKLAGKRAADAVISRKNYYEWIYKIIATEYTTIDDILIDNNLMIK